MSALNEGGKFWVFNPNTTLWSQTSAPSGDIPEPRSYHSLAVIDVTLTFPSVAEYRTKFIFMLDVLQLDVFQVYMSTLFLRIRGLSVPLHRDLLEVEPLLWQSVPFFYDLADLTERN
jgi:hypothetical protein